MKKFAFMFMIMSIACMGAEVEFAGIHEGMSLAQVKMLARIESKHDNIYIINGLKKAPRVVDHAIIFTVNDKVLKIAANTQIKTVYDIIEPLKLYVSILDEMRKKYGVGESRKNVKLENISISGINSGRQYLTNTWRINNTSIILKLNAVSPTKACIQIVYEYPSFVKHIRYIEKKKRQKRNEAVHGF